MKRVLILACGNTLRGDDGVAWRIGSSLQAEFQDKQIDSAIEVILTQQLLPEHAEPLSRTDTAIFLDCSAIAKPGVVSIHCLSLAETLPRSFYPPSRSRFAAQAYAGYLRERPRTRSIDNDRRRVFRARGSVKRGDHCCNSHRNPGCASGHLRFRTGTTHSDSRAAPPAMSDAMCGRPATILNYEYARGAFIERARKPQC